MLTRRPSRSEMAVQVRPCRSILKVVKMSETCGDYGGETNKGKPCKRNAGAGTDHEGEGRCSQHEIDMLEKYGITGKKVKSLAAAGLPIDSEQAPDIKGYFGISKGTWENICQKHPNIRDSYRQGRSGACANIGQSLYQKAVNGDITAQKFYLKCQAGWTPTQGHEISGPEGRPIAIEQLDLSHLSNEELAEIEEKITRGE